MTSVKKITSIYISPITADVQAAVLPQYSKVSRGVFSLILHIQVLSTLIKNLQKMLRKWFSIQMILNTVIMAKIQTKKVKKTLIALFSFWSGKPNIAQVSLPSWSIILLMCQYWNFRLLFYQPTDWPKIILLTACATKN